MELTAYELALVAGGFGIAGALLGVLLTYRLSRKLAEQQFEHLKEVSRLDAWHTAAQAYVLALSPDIALLETDAEPATDLYDYFRSSYERQSLAVAAFEHYVPAAKRTDFRADWQRHCYGTDAAGNPLSPNDDGLGMPHSSLLFLHYSQEAHLAGSEAPRELARRALRRLLSYAAATS